MVYRTDQLDQLNESNYVCPQDEVKLYHVVQEVKEFNPKTGQRISVPVLQKYKRKTFELDILPRLPRLGYTLRIVFDPVKYESTISEARRAAELAARAEAKMKADEELREQIRREEAAKLRAELKKQKEKGEK
ncbi:hypothetical protein BF702P1_00043 [Bacteroides phage BF702P1]|jgi:hypothetical protein|nr:hypothetical protein BF702P1_00043 [Bacteroides phage BF702P1]